jgi:FixJ family two-component response regulator
VPEAVVLDVAMPGMNGLELQKTLALAGNSAPIIFLTCHATIPMSVEAMKAGAVDFLTKPVEKNELLKAIKTAIERGAREREARSEQRKLKDLVAGLTPREQDVFGLVVRGMMNKHIAAELGTGTQNIKIHRRNMMLKMQAESLAELVIKAGRLGMSGQGVSVMRPRPESRMQA